MNKYNIFYFCYEGFSKLGKINNHILETVSWMAKFGHDVHFFNPKITQPEFNENVKVHLVSIIPFSIFKWLSFDIISFFYLMVEYFRQKPNCIYFRETSSLTPLFFSKIFSIPLLVEINGWILQELKESGYSGLKYQYILCIQKLNYKYATKLIPVSDGLKELIIKKYKISQKKIQVIENGTNPEKFHPINMKDARIKTSLPQHKKIIGFIGSCYHYHGIQFLIHTAKILIQKYPDIYFVIAGDGEERLKWIKMANDLGLEKYFNFPGKVPFSDANYYINSFDVCVAPWHLGKLQYNSLSPMKLFDYLSCQKPVICSPVSNIKKIIDDNHCGITVDVIDSQKFADAISFLLENEPKAKEFGKNGRKVILEKYTWKRTTENIISTIKSL